MFFLVEEHLLFAWMQEPGAETALRPGLDIVMDAVSYSAWFFFSLRFLFHRP